MPNHVTNKLLLRGPQEDIERLLAQGRVTLQGDPEPRDFSLAGFIAPPDHPDYFAGSCGHKHYEKEEHPNCWYVWNNKYWGTKWDCYETRIERLRDGEAAIYFDTAWAPPMPVISSIVLFYPRLNIEFSYMDEDMLGGGGGVIVFQGGEIIEEEGGINGPDHPRFRDLALDLKGYDPSEMEDEDEEE